MHWEHLTATGDSVIVVLPHTKTSQREGIQQHVVITDSLAVNMVRLLQSRGTHSGAIFAHSAHQFRKFFDSLLERLSVANLELRPYSLRRGGATYLFQRKIPLDRILLIGRWTSATTAKIYLQDGVSRLSQQRIARSVTSHLTQLCAQLHSAIPC